MKGKGTKINNRVLIYVCFNSRSMYVFMLMKIKFC
jgi:hypothetical protein